MIKLGTVNIEVNKLESKLLTQKINWTGLAMKIEKLRLNAEDFDRFKSVLLGPHIARIKEQLNDREKQGLHSNFVDLSSGAQSVYNADRAHHFAHNVVERLSVQMKGDVRGKESHIFNSMIREKGFRLDYGQLRQLRPDLKADYFKATFENDLEVTEYAK